MSEDTIRAAIITEASRLTTDVLYSEKGHFQAARLWNRCHYGLGIPATILAALAGSSFGGQIESTSAIAAAALAAAALAGLMTFLKPNELAVRHHAHGVAYAALRRKIRQFVEIDAPAGQNDLRTRLDELTDAVIELQKDALPIPRMSYKLAKKGIVAGEAAYQDDQQAPAQAAPTEQNPSAPKS